MNDRSSQPQASQLAAPPPGAEPWCSCEPTRCEGIGRCRWHAMNYSPLAAPPQGASRLLHEQERIALVEKCALEVVGFCNQFGDEATDRLLMLRSQLAASPLPAPQEPAEPFAWYTLDDDPEHGPSIEFYADQPLRGDAKPLFSGPMHTQPLAWVRKDLTDPVSSEFRHRTEHHRAGWPVPLYAAPAPDSTRGTP